MSPLRVLYVDDEPDIREVALLSLQLDKDIEARAVDSGAQALALAQKAEWVPDVILLDVMMPGMDGPTTFAKLRDETANPAPVVFLTARAQAAERARLLELGAIAVVTKPFDPLSLAQELRAILGANARA